MEKMKKFAIVILTLAFLACRLPVAESANLPVAEDAVPIPLLTAEVTLLNKEGLEHGFRFHVMLPDGELAVYAPIHVQFLSRAGGAVTPEIFLRSYRERRISISFIELGDDSFLIMEARGL